MKQDKGPYRSPYQYDRITEVSLCLLDLSAAFDTIDLITLLLAFHLGLEFTALVFVTFRLIYHPVISVTNVYRLLFSAYIFL